MSLKPYPAVKVPDANTTTRVNTTVDTALLISVCLFVERRDMKKYQMSEVLRIVFNEYAAQNNIA